MKKILISFLAVICIALVVPQKGAAQFRYGPIVGVDFTTLKFRQDLMPVDRQTGFTGGIMAEMMFPGIGFGIDLGLYYQMLGAKLHLGDREIWASQGYGTERTYLHTMTIPVHLRFKYTRFNGFEEKLAPFVYAGPSFDFTLAHNKLEAFNFPAGNICLDFGVGAEIFQKWQVSLSYSMGMTYAFGAKILTDFTAKNRSWNVRLAYLF